MRLIRMKAGKRPGNMPCREMCFAGSGNYAILDTIGERGNVLSLSPYKETGIRSLGIYEET